MVLAAGIGSRFGGDKQLVAVGPGVETLLDYTLFDAARAGFARAVLVVRPEMDDGFRRCAEARYRGRIAVQVVEQTLEASPLGGGEPPLGRHKPWGTAHAVLAAEQAVRGPFAVVNADDFYGAEAFEAAARFLREGPTASGSPAWALAAYRLGDTLSKEGAVNRALCRVDDAGCLVDLQERSLGMPDAAGEGDSLVSMNFWCFDRTVFDLLRTGFADFVATADLQHDEYRLPDALRAGIARRKARVRLLRHGGRWFGLTYPQDVAIVRERLRRLVEQGRYPASLWAR
ncbi:MAG TPA: NTP transferase domain-containing protein [Thermoanaerobaculia bacterium]|nr:NTP transferase domain-containing protein [Thermoanaerobaculia bacterium]